MAHQVLHRFWLILVPPYQNALMFAAFPMVAMLLGPLCGFGNAYGQAIEFESHVAPLLVQHCLECHNTNEQSGGLSFSSSETFSAGGESGPAVIRHDANMSLMMARISKQEMPPPKNDKPQPLPEKDVRILQSWVDQGAPWPSGRTLDAYERTTDQRAGRDWWSLQPIQRPVQGGDQEKPTIDQFIGVQLADRNQHPAPPADKRTLLRRLYYDLIGLPPSLEEVETFEADISPDAYENVVDRLLASKAFGERWARHWLDVARFAETNGYERDALKQHAWRYRDWVIQSFNEDMPYDQFVIQQLAGDEIENRTESSTIATGFLRLGTWDDEPNDPQEYQYERLEDLVHSTTTAFLGMTVKCARCHDHKFDPIPQTDYFRIAAAFWAGPVAHRNREWNGGPTEEELGFDVLGWTDISTQPPPLHLLHKGSIHRPGSPVAAGSLTSVPAIEREFQAAPAASKTTHLRLQLAQWITDPNNPITARVIVNRLWQHHFGDGLVRTPDNFGFLGQPPTHPELLDFLADELMQNGWYLKPIHKLMVMSETYRQSSTHPDQLKYESSDASNLGWWKFNRRRLDAESLRDSILTASNRLDLRTGGPSFYAPISSEALEGLSMKSGAYPTSPPDETNRRSIYMFTKRSLTVPLMAVFDSCESSTPTGKREQSTVAPQALALLNNPWIYEQCQAIASRVIATGVGEQERIRKTWQYALGREPRNEEVELANSYYLQIMSHSPAGSDDHHAWTALCHALINSNEFIYVD